MSFDVYIHKSRFMPFDGRFDYNCKKKKIQINKVNITF